MLSCRITRSSTSSGSGRNHSTGGGSSLFLNGPIVETGGARKLTVDGFDAVVLGGSGGATKNYTGGTTVHRGQLILQIGRMRRVLQLPSPVDQLGAADAVLEDGTLEIHFR